MEFENLDKVFGIVASVMAIFIYSNAIYTKRRLIGKNIREIAVSTFLVISKKKLRQKLLILCNAFMFALSGAMVGWLLFFDTLPRAGAVLIVLFTLSSVNWIHEFRRQIKTL